MEKQQWDQLYHLLRTASNSSDKEELEAIVGITDHLIEHRNEGCYGGLLDYLTYYGNRFLLDKTCRIVESQALDFSRIVDFGAGFGWLGEGMSKYFKVPFLQIDKRRWSGNTMVADFETPEGIESVLSVLKPDDLIVMSDFLHCLDNPDKIIAKFTAWNLVVLEYVPFSLDYMDSYKTQLERLGAKPFLGWGSIMNVDPFPSHRKVCPFNLDPYILKIIWKPYGKEAKTKVTT